MKNRGFTIIEVIVCIAVLGSSLAVFGTLFSILRINKSGSFRFAATKLAQEEIDILRTLPLSALSNRTESDFIYLFYNRGAAGAVINSAAISSPNALELANASNTIAAVLLPYNKLTNFSLETYLKNTETTERSGIIFRARDYDNYYFFYIKNDRIALEKKVDGTLAPIQDIMGTFADNTWYKIKIVASGTSLSIYLNDVLTATATDDSFSSGYTALASYSDITYFDDVTLVSGSQTSFWNFDDVTNKGVPSDWQKFDTNNLPICQGLLTISEPYGVSTIKKIEAKVVWQEKDKQKTVSLSTMKTE